MGLELIQVQLVQRALLQVNYCVKHMHNCSFWSVSMLTVAVVSEAYAEYVLSVKLAVLIRKNYSYTSIGQIFRVLQLQASWVVTIQGAPKKK